MGLRALHHETMDYVPKMIAVAIIGAHPEQYGFYNVKFLPPMRYATVTVDNAVDLRVIADCAGTSSKDRLAQPRIDPVLHPGLVPRLPDPHPARPDRRVQAGLRLPGLDQKTTFKTHTVQKGESIRSIAAGYLTSAKQLAAMNGSSRTRRSGRARS